MLPVFIPPFLDKGGKGWLHLADILVLVQYQDNLFLNLLMPESVKGGKEIIPVRVLNRLQQRLIQGGCHGQGKGLFQRLLTRPVCHEIDVGPGYTELL